MPRHASKFKVGRWVRVHWWDATSHDPGWMLPEKIDPVQHGIAECITAGVVARVEKDQVILAMSRFPRDGIVGVIWSIPLAWISKVELWPSGR